MALKFRGETLLLTSPSKELTEESNFRGGDNDVEAEVETEGITGKQKNQKL